MWHLHCGHYFADIALVTPVIDTLGYSFQIHLTERAFTLLAIINVDEPQSHDTRCSQLSLSDTGEVKRLGKRGGIQVCM